jgi:hypothetical protein
MDMNEREWDESDNMPLQRPICLSFAVTFCACNRTFDSFGKHEERFSDLAQWKV